MMDLKHRTGLRKAAALLAAGVLSAGTVCTCFTASAEGEAAEDVIITVTFELDDDIEFGKDADPADFEPVQVNITQKPKVKTPKGKLLKDGLVFSGWTYDGVSGYLQDTYLMLPADTTEDIVFKPCFYKNSATVKPHDVIYSIVVDGEPVDLTDRIEETSGRPGQLVLPDYTRFYFDESHCTSKGWTDGTNIFDGQYLVMPDHDVELTGVISQLVHYIYVPGDVDGIVGNTEFISPVFIEGFPNELAAKDRFTRLGYTITGWTSSLTGETYKPLQTVITPAEDSTLTAVWSPVQYKVSFKPGLPATPAIKVDGSTGETIICPEMEYTKDGYEFAGWQDAESGEVFAAGDEFVVPGVLPGRNPELSAVWVLAGQTPTEETTQPPAQETTAAPAEETTKSPAEEATQAATDAPAPTEKETQSTTAAPGEVNYGDANCDSKINVSDVVSVLQFIANKGKYPLSPEGLVNADVDGKDGITGDDAVAIQQRDAGIIGSLPLTSGE